MKTVWPDVVFYFPIIPGPRWNRHDPYWRHKHVTAFCYDRQWLPKDAGGLCEFSPGVKAEIWSGTDCEHPYVAFKFV